MGLALYQQVYEKLRTAIQTGQYRVGDRLPSQAELTATYEVSTITLKRALELLRDEGYVVRRPRLGTFVVSEVATSAPALPSLREPLVGCVLTDFDDTFGTRMLGGLLDSAEGSMNLLVKRSLGDKAAEDALIRSLVGSGVRALILQPSSSEYVPPAILELVTRGFPVVILDRVFDGVPVSAVYSDNVTAGRMATEYLFSLGHERVGLVTAASNISTVEDRRDGFIGAHAVRHVPHDEQDEYRSARATIPGSRVDPEEDIEGLTEFLANRAGPTAFVATEYNIAVMLREAARRLGKAVPEDLSIVCFDNPDAFYDAAQFRFSHIRQDQEGMGRAAIELVAKQLDSPGLVRKVSLETHVVAGGSTRQPAD